MTKSPFVNFLLGVVAGGMLATILVLHIVTNQVEARNAALSSSIAGANEETRRTVDTAQKVIDAWQTRATACEAKFAVGTIVYQKQPMASFALLHGIAAFDVNDPGSPKPSLYIPAQVDIYTDRPDVRYEWIDGRTGAAKGAVQVARSDIIHLTHNCAHARILPLNLERGCVCIRCCGSWESLLLSLWLSGLCGGQS
jgi:hypothetical protein